MIHTFVLRRGTLFALVACLAAIGLAIPATPASAEVTSLTKCQAINAPGKYRLDANVTTELPVCFSVVADNVTLILDGHTITGAGKRRRIGIAVVGSGGKILGPGTLSGWDDGILLQGGSGKVRGVTATGSGLGIGINVASSGNDVRGNVTTGNTMGILVRGGASGNTIIGNFAHNNTTDLVDQNTNCDSNVWRGNDFGTANQPCIH